MCLRLAAAIRAPAVDVIRGVDGARDKANPFPAPKKLLTVEKDFGSWSALSKKYFDEKEGLIVKIIAASGKAK